MRLAAAPRTLTFVVVSICCAAQGVSAAAPFDHTYAPYRDLLTRFVHGDRVDYRELTANRGLLDGMVVAIGRVPAADEARWDRAERFAFWINAYNILTLRSIVDHYPIRGSMLRGIRTMRWLLRGH